MAIHGVTMTGFIRTFFLACIVAAISISCGSTDRYVNTREPVYIMDTGIRYHRESCRYVTEDARKVYLGFAVDKEFKPCPVCTPPRLIEAEPDPGRSFRLTVMWTAIFICVFVGGPFLFRRLLYYRRAVYILKCRFGERWDDMSKETRKREIEEVIEHFKNPPSDKRAGDDSMR